MLMGIGCKCNFAEIVNKYAVGRFSSDIIGYRNEMEMW